MAASQQKKKGGSRAQSSSGGRRTAPSKSGGRSRKAAPQPAARPFRREVGAVVCFLLAIFASFGYFHKQAVFIDLFCDLLKSLLGYGFWLVPPALLLGAYILGFHRGRPVRLRLCCALLLPLIFSCLVHGVLADPLPWDGQLWGSLVESGRALRSGGALGGILAQAFVTLFTDIGSTIVFALVGVLVGLTAFNRSLSDVARWIFDRPRYVPEPEPEPVSRRENRTREEREPAPAPERRPAIDIPVEDGPLVGREPAPAPPGPRR